MSILNQKLKLFLRDYAESERRAFFEKTYIEAKKEVIRSMTLKAELTAKKNKCSIIPVDPNDDNIKSLSRKAAERMLHDAVSSISLDTE